MRAVAGPVAILGAALAMALAPTMLAAGGCRVHQDAIVVPPQPILLPVDPDAGDTACERAGRRLSPDGGLGCRNADGVPLWQSPGGKPFAELCRAAAADGRDYHPGCLERLERCEDLKAVFERGCE